MATYIVEYSSNNSGGSWWLTDSEWVSLEAHGWTVDWVRDHPDDGLFSSMKENGRWLGAMATRAKIEIEAKDEVEAEIIAEHRWQEALPLQNLSDEGCECCGPPHYLYVQEKK